MSREDEKKIEAILFASGEPVSLKRICKVLGKKEITIKDSVKKLQERLEKESGLRILENNKKFQIVTAPEYSSVLSKLFKLKHNEELTRAALEVLAIIAYAGPVSRAEIESIRGINSVYSIRGLELRGLIEKDSQNNIPKYDISFRANRKFGLKKRQDLPEWDKIKNKIEDKKEALVKYDERNN